MIKANLESVWTLHIGSFSCPKTQEEGDIMARPTKSITTRTGHMSKADIDKRLEYEAKLRGDSDVDFQAVLTHFF